MSQSHSAPGWVLWAGTVGITGPVQDRVRAAVGAGCSRVSVSPLDVERARTEGTSAADLGRSVRAAGLEIVLDPVMGWHPGPVSPRSRFARFTIDEALRMAADLQAVALNVVAGPPGSIRPDQLADPFGRVCDRAEGAQVMLEFMPMSAVPDLATAWGLVGPADRPNGGITLDTWHFFRGNPDFALLETVPGDRVFTVQVDDAPVEVDPDPREDTLHRLMPGDGCFDLDRVLRVLHGTGGLSWVGAEVLSPVTEAMESGEAARLANHLVRELVERARRPA